VRAGDAQDRDGAELALADMTGRFTQLKKLWPDGGCTGELIENVKRWYGRRIEIVKRSEANKFVVLPKRWTPPQSATPYSTSSAARHSDG